MGLGTRHLTKSRVQLGVIWSTNKNRAQPMHTHMEKRCLVIPLDIRQGQVILGLYIC